MTSNGCKEYVFFRVFNPVQKFHNTANKAENNEIEIRICGRTRHRKGFEGCVVGYHLERGGIRKKQKIETAFSFVK